MVAARRAIAPRRKQAGGGHGRAGAPDIKWQGPVKWAGWEAGMARAKAEGKPVCLVVYADWCPRCKELVPALVQDAELAQIAEKVVLIRQDSDDKPAWLTERFGQYGGYVPRIFLLDASGQVREDLTSGHPRYPYFYTPQTLATLKANLKTLGG